MAALVDETATNSTSLPKPLPAQTASNTPHVSRYTLYKRRLGRLLQHLSQQTVKPIAYFHRRTPYVRTLPLSALVIIVLLVVVNLVVWAISALILLHHPKLISTAALSYTLGLRHALDADHISAIDLMTRRLIASGQRPVTVGTFFSLGHSTIVIVTSIVVAATAAGVSKRFSGFSQVGGIIGSSISAAFLILLGAMNAYILYRLILQLRKILRLSPSAAAEEAWKIEGGGVVFRVLKKLFKIIDRPWKMYPLGVLFGLGFDTSSEIALLGISSIQGAKGTGIWLILVFPVLFTVGMCLIDTIDGALMLALYVKPMDAFGVGGVEEAEVEGGGSVDLSQQLQEQQPPLPQNHHSPPPPLLPPPLPSDNIPEDTTQHQQPFQTPIDKSLTTTTNPHISTHPPISTQNQNKDRAKDPLAFLYYSILLTSLTVLVALIIGTIQFLTVLLNTTRATGPFWAGVARAGDLYEVIGGAICGGFVVVGGVGVLVYPSWRRWVEKRRRERGMDGGGGGDGVLVREERGRGKEARERVERIGDDVERG